MEYINQGIKPLKPKTGGARQQLRQVKPVSTSNGGVVHSGMPNMSSPMQQPMQQGMSGGIVPVQMPQTGVPPMNAAAAGMQSTGPGLLQQFSYRPGQ